MPTGINVTAENTVISHCEIFNGGQGIRIYVGRLVTVEYCHIHALGLRGTNWDVHGIAVQRQSAAATGWADGIKIQYNTIHDTGGDSVQDQSACLDYGGAGALKYLIIDNNEAYDNDEQCVDIKGGQYIRISNNDFHNTSSVLIINTTPTDDCVNARAAASTGWEIFNNRLHDNADGAIETNTGGLKMCTAWKVYNNLIYKTTTSPLYNGIAVNLCDDSATTFYNNTLYQNKRTSGSTKTGGLAACTNGSNVKNNIFYDNGSESGSYGNIASSYYNCGSASGTPDYNYVYPTTNGQTGNHAITNSNPGFTNAGLGSFSLLSSSVNRLAGTSLGSPYNADFAGTPRPQGTAWDLGAFEYGGIAPLAPVIKNIQ
jgi:hypothetical protein